MKYHPNKHVLQCTFAIEEGLLLLSNPLCLAIIKSCLARAWTNHPVTICHFLVEATHVHLILVVNDPDDVEGFVRCFKTESAHMLNRLLGRRKRTIWCEGYDSPVVLTPIRTVTAIVYDYGNPGKDNLETSIDRYPGLSSWKMFRSQEYTKRWKRIRRPQCKALPRDAHSLRGYTKEAEKLLAESKEIQEFTIDPNAWMVAFGIDDPQEHERINKRIIERVRTFEERAERKRQREGKRVIGRERLIAQRLTTTYRPVRTGKRMWCLSERRKVRVAFIAFLKALMAEARAVRARWKQGDTSVRYPPGLYPPSMPKLANAYSP